SRFAVRSFYVRGLQRKRAVLPALPELNLATTPDLLRSAQAWFSLLVLERELLLPASNVIGRLVRASAQTVHMRLIRPGANWDRERCQLRTSDITSIGFGGRYENTLADVAELKYPRWK